LGQPGSFGHLEKNSSSKNSRLKKLKAEKTQGNFLEKLKLFLKEIKILPT